MYRMNVVREKTVKILIKLFTPSGRRGPSYTVERDELFIRKEWKLGEILSLSQLFNFNIISRAHILSWIYDHRRFRWFYINSTWAVERERELNMMSKTCRIDFIEEMARLMISTLTWFMRSFRRCVRFFPLCIYISFINIQQLSIFPWHTGTNNSSEVHYRVMNIHRQRVDVECLWKSNEWKKHRDKKWKSAATRKTATMSRENGKRGQAREPKGERNVNKSLYSLYFAFIPKRLWLNWAIQLWQLIRLFAKVELEIFGSLNIIIFTHSSLFSVKNSRESFLFHSGKCDSLNRSTKPQSVEHLKISEPLKITKFGEIFK